MAESARYHHLSLDLWQVSHYYTVQIPCDKFKGYVPVGKLPVVRTAFEIARGNQNNFQIWNKIMSRRCELTGKGVMSGNNVSHANNRNRRKFLPNLCDVTLLSDALNQRVRLRICAQALRTVEHRGGLDAFLNKAKESELSQKARLIKRQIAKAQAEAAA